MKGFCFFACALVSLAGSAGAQGTKGQVSASNGIVVDTYIDEFAGRAEYSAPTIRFTSAERNGSGAAFVAKIKKAGVVGGLNIQGFITYSGEWQYFGSALFKGGEEVSYTRTGGDVGSCRYGCTLTEKFVITLTPNQITKYSEGGNIPIQIRARNGNTAMLLIPTAYIAAVNEVAK